MIDLRVSTDLLKIKNPEKLFPDTLESAKRQYRDLVKIWHPDTCKDSNASSVFEHVTKLYKQVEIRIQKGHYGFAGVAVLNSGKSTLRYHREGTFELGKYYICPDQVVYIFDKQYVDLLQNFFGISWSSFKFASPQMEKEVRRYLPIDVVCYGSNELKVNKRKELVCLRDVLDYYGGMMAPRDVAWIISSLYNIACYLNYTGMTHNDISPDNYFIDPKDHSGALLGGWWYGVKRGSPISKVPNRTFNFIPWKVKTQKVASRATDAELILATARELLGDINGKNLNPDTPKPMREWLTSVAKADPIENYTTWGKVLAQSFGPKKFVKMDLSSETLY